MKYAIKTQGITTKIEADIGEPDLNHPLNGCIQNVKHTTIIVTCNGENNVYQKDVEFIEFLLNNGWELIHSGQIKVYNEDYTNYLFKYVTD